VPGSWFVRRAAAADAEAVWPLVREFAVSFAPERASFDHALRSAVSRDDMLVVLAVLEGSVRGYLLATRHPTFFAGRPVAWVEEVMVAADARRLGIGRALMRAAEGWAAESGAAYVALATRRAAAFYTALDYEESATFFRKRLE
jgi:GNAT superfamily N-acetyltransferase